VNLAAHFSIKQRADFFFGFNRVEDTGDGRPNPLGDRLYTSVLPLIAAQTFPLTFHSPLARFSVKLHRQVRWNFGYQYYGYDERFSNLQTYRAHTGYTSVLWSF
jgi:hypothetical protein